MNLAASHVSSGDHLFFGFEKVLGEGPHSTTPLDLVLVGYTETLRKGLSQRLSCVLKQS